MRYILCLIIALCALPARAEPVHDRPALWKVADADTTIWLFGTIHMLGGDHVWLEDKVERAFANAGELAVETRMPDPEAAQTMVIRRALDPLGKPLSAKLAPALNERLAQRMAIDGMPIARLQSAEPWYLAMLLEAIAYQRIGLTSDNGVDVTLMAKAEQAGKTIVPLEGFDEQLAYLDELPEPLQVALLEATLDDIDSGKALIEKLVESWSKGDIATLASLMNADFEKLEPLRKTLLDDRNARWADWVAKRMDRPGTVFLAVGAGHLGGRNNVRALLEAKGYTVERVQ
jgi:uncharacterized protein YbaP (TraB family)